MISSSVRARHLLPFVGAAVIAIATACSNGSPGPTGEPINVTVTPSPANVLTCSTTQFTGTVTGTTDLSIDWYVTPAGVGTCLNGAYTAPLAAAACW